MPYDLPEKLTDHRDIGRQLDLFSFHEVAPGAPFWLPKGMVIFKELEKIAREINDREGYQEISTPILVKSEVFKKSGHWKHYRENMFYFKNPRDKNEQLVIKPMNCPESSYVFNSKIRSYRELPLRLAEIGRLNRNELSGTLGGLFRVRQITMDDAHIYLGPEQVEKEVAGIIKIIDDFYSIFGFKTRYVLATRPEKHLGTKKEWQKAETALQKALASAGVQYSTASREGAFYGPKVEAYLSDSQGRNWQMGTAQLDLVMLAKQFETYYIDEEGKKKLPWVIHRAVFGSIERFIGVLLEHTGGALPLWLSPVQVVMANINSDQLGYTRAVADKLIIEGIRVELSNQDDTISKKIREAEMQKVPYVAIIGAKEVETSTLAIRQRGKGDIGQKKLEEFSANLKEEIKSRK